MRKYIALICLALVLIFPAYTSFAQDAPFAQTPVIFLSAGQGGGIETVMAICDMAGLKYDWAEDYLTSDQLASGVGLPAYDLKKNLPVLYKKYSEVPNGTQYQTIVFVMSVPISTTDWDLYLYETTRLSQIIKWAKENKIKIIGMHVHGAIMRGQPPFYKTPMLIEEIIDLVTPQCDMLMVTAAGNQDGKFTNIAEANNIPIEIAPNARALGPIMQKVFGL